jgi:hypothetical protein
MEEKSAPFREFLTGSLLGKSAVIDGLRSALGDARRVAVLLAQPRL